MAQDNKTTVVLDLDNKEFVKKLKDSLGLLGQIGETESVSNLSGMFLKVGAVAGVAAAAVLAVKAALDLAVEAEHIKQINQSFDALTKSAGLAGDTIKNELMSAVKGLADDTDVLQSANKAIVAMGGNASHLGETMELARKATALFGGDMLGHFETINTAIASGNTRALRGLGLIIDQDQAYKDYAKTLGVSAKYLDDAGKKQAILNAVIEQGKKKFSDVDETTLQTTNNLKKMGVTFGQIKEIAVLAWDKIAGPTVSKAVGAVADAFDHLAKRAQAAFGQGEEKAKARKELLIEQKEIEERNLKSWTHWYNSAMSIELAKKRLASYNQELEKIEASEERSMQLALKKSQASGPREDAGSAPTEKKGVDREKIAEDTRKFNADLRKINTERIDAELEESGRIDVAEDAFREKRVAMEIEANQKIAQIKIDAAALGLEDATQTQMAIENVNTTFHMKMLDEERELEQARIQALDNYQNRATTAAGGISAAFKKGSMQGKADLKNWGKTGAMMFDSVKNRSVSAFKAMGDGSKSASEAMKGFMFGAIGDTATAKGTEMLLSGIWPPNPVAIAGGGALIALGAALSSQGDGGGGGVPTGGGGGGGGAGGSGDAMADAKPEPQQQERKAVSVNIHGNLYETDQTRTRLMDMIREAGDFTDFNISKIGQ